MPILPAAAAIYRLDADGTDSSGNGRTLTGGVFGSPTGGAPKFGAGCLVRLTGQTVTGLALSPSAGLTVSCWVFFTGSGGVANTVGCLDSGAATLFGVSIDSIDNQLSTVVGGATAFTSGPLAILTWHLVTVAYAGGVVTTYIDGAAVDSQSLTPVGTIDRLQVGASGTQAGCVDGAAFVLAGLSADQVAYLWNGGTGRLYPATPLDYHAAIRDAIVSTLAARFAADGVSLPVHGCDDVEGIGRIQDLPCCIVCPVGPEQHRDGGWTTNLRTGIGYPILVAYLSSGVVNAAQSGPITLTDFRRYVEILFQYKRLAGVSQVGYCEVSARPVVFEKEDFQQLQTALVVVAVGRFPRA